MGAVHKINFKTEKSDILEEDGEEKLIYRVRFKKKRNGGDKNIKKK